jgi:hypothetical protein
MVFAQGVQKAVHWVRSLDAKTMLIFVLLLSDAAHVGRLFSVREASDRTFIGYVLAFAIDGVLAVSLYELAHADRRSHRLFALSVFLCACTVSGGFNVAYYREQAPTDPGAISILLGATAPVLAAFLSVMKAVGNTERVQAEQAEQEAERGLELEKYRIEQAERTRRLEIEQKERTKREQAKARAERARADASAQAKRTGSVQACARNNGREGDHRADGNGRLKPGELDDVVRAVLLEQPDIGPRPLARTLDCSPSTAAGILKRLRDNGREGVR